MSFEAARDLVSKVAVEAESSVLLDDFVPFDYLANYSSFAVVAAVVFVVVVETEMELDVRHSWKIVIYKL